IHVTAKDVSVRSFSPSVLIHGDLFDKRPSNTQNKLFFQHALVNGELELAADHSALAMQALHWMPRPGTALRPALLAPRWRDEHGHPLALHAEDDKFILAERHGFDTVPKPQELDRNELTNRTLGVHSTAKLRMMALDPVALYGKANDADNPHYWVD